MKNIELLPISEAARKRLATFAREYRKNARIEIEVAKVEGSRVVVRVEQKVLVNDLFLTKKELTARVREMFDGELPEGYKLTVSAVNHDRRDIAAVDKDYIRGNMDRLGLKAKDLTSYLGFDKAATSSFLSGDRNLTKSTKAAFYYFFKYYELVQANSK